MRSRPLSRSGLVSLAVVPLALMAVPQPAVAAVGPNGQIAYVASGPRDDPFGSPTQEDIWVMNADGTGQVNLTDSPSVDDNSPVWSPDGNRIAFVSDSFARNLMVMNADGTGQLAIASGAYSPSWSPDGTSIAVLKERPGDSPALVIVDVATGAETFVTDTLAMEPVWSPDGSRFAFVAMRQEQSPDPITGEPVPGVQAEIVVANADGSGEVIVSAGQPGSDRASYLEEDRAPAWSPDGSMLVFMSQAQVPACCGPWQLWGVNADGTGLTDLTADATAQDVYPSWSPDGTTIVFSRANQTGFDLFTMPAPTALPIPTGQARMVATAGPTGPATPLTSDGNAADPSWGVQSSAPESFDLTVLKQGRGKVVSTPAGIQCGTDCTQSYADGSRVTLKAVPARGWRFARWTGACSGARTTCPVTLDQDRRAKAWFVKRR